MTASAQQTVVVERRVAASQGRVWEAVTDLRGMPRLLAGVESVEVLTGGSFGVGTRWRETRRMLGKRATEEMTVTESEPPERYVTVAASHGMHYTSELRLIPAGPQATTVRMAFTARPASGRPLGLLGRLVAPLGSKAVARALAKDLADIARAIESTG
ncbi:MULTISPECIES: SRPBCC family protein [unclassified Streptomyces]|uniref:SRPBCC family protein n=1 Tax=unclassified Streptomyces TaxID=2593676 RepID=UPI0008DCB6DB|nr:MULTISPECIES: SRPBCC family protein [unclassified Streptomyces]OII67075.1 polyketide cyclase/dehydrase [Streptomyces sp. CC77]